MEWMNWLIVIAALLMIWRLIDGIRNGFVEELARMVTLVFILLIAALVVIAVGGYMNKNIVTVVVAIVLILVACALHKVIMLPLDVFEKGTKLKAMKVIDKILGVAIGLVEGVLVVWFVFAVATSIQDMGPNVVTGWVVENITRSSLLSMVQSMNPIQVVMEVLINRAN